MRPKVRTTDQTIAAIARLAHGVVTRLELLAAGITPAEIKERLNRGSLVAVFRGVYRVGHTAPSTEATYMAAVKAGGENAVISGPAAAHLLGLTRGAPPRAEVTAPTERRIKGVKTRRIQLLASERTTWNRIPITTPARTLLDLAATLDSALLSRAVHEAQIRHQVTPAAIAALTERHPNARGATRLRRIATGDTRTTLSRLESEFLKVLEKAKLPLPNTNQKTDGRYVDCRWPGRRLTVELDSFGYHNSRHSWELDRRREREAYARGDQLRRYTWADVCEDPRQMLSELQRLLR